VWDVECPHIQVSASSEADWLKTAEGAVVDIANKVLDSKSGEQRSKYPVSSLGHTPPQSPLWAAVSLERSGRFGSNFVCG
jgi:hypothetical protein